MITVWVFRNAMQVAQYAADDLIKSWKHCVRERGQFVAGLATGSTPVPCYHLLVEGFARGELTAAEVACCQTFNLDEYLPPVRQRARWKFHEQSYLCFMNQHLFAHLPFAPGSNHLLNPAAADLEEECRRYEQRIAEAGGIDLQLLGIGTNGHVGFAEPGTPLAIPEGRTQIVPLARQTIQDNAAKYFADRPGEVPTEALSMGLGTILEARRLLLLATGSAKRTAVAAAVLGPVTTWCPASYLQDHEDCTFVLDETAAELLLSQLEVTKESFGTFKPGRYELSSQQGHPVVLHVDESLCEATDLDEEFSTSA